MSKVNSGQAPSTLIPEYIGSDFDAVLSCADNMTDIKTVVENLNDIEAVVDNIGIITTVAPHIEAVQDVADNLNDVHSVVDNLNAVTTVSSYIYNVNAVAPHIDDVDVVSNNMSNIGAVLSNMSTVATVATDIANVNAVGSNITNVDVVANNIGDVNTVASNIDDMGAVATNIEYVKGVAEGIAGLPVVSYIGATPPPLAAVGAEWYCITDGRTYVYYHDGDSAQWIESSPQSTIGVSDTFALWKRSLAEIGLTLVGTFQEGCTVTAVDQAVLDFNASKVYQWKGTIPVDGKVIPVESTPSSTGGVSPTAWVDRTDGALRDQLISDSASEGLALIPVVSADSSLNALGVRIDDSREKLDESFTRGTNPSVFGTFKTPAELGIKTGPLVYYTKPSGAGLVTDLSRFFPAGYNLGPGSAEAAGLKAYYVSQTGSNSNDGLSWATPLASIATAANKADADIVFIRAGRWTVSNGITGKTLTRDLVICCPEGRAFISNQRDTTWTNNGDGTYTSATLGGTPIRVADMRYVDDFGDLVWFTKLNTLAEVQATPYSWAITAGSGSTQVVTINLPSLTPTNANTIALRSQPVQIDYNAQPFKFYAKNITFFGGDSAGMTPKNGVDDSVYASEGCHYLSSCFNDCLRVQGVGLIISIRCKASNGYKDGFNYHAATNTAGSMVQTHFIEIDCISHNHQTTMGTANGSTAHEAAVGFRIGGVYGYGVGPGVADINDTKTFNVACTSNGGDGDPNAKGFQATDNCKMWLHNCTAAKNMAAGNIIAGFAAQDSSSLLVRGSYADKYAITGSATINKF